MGGKNAAVVLGDADLELAAEQVMLGAFRSTGQKCTATSRLIVTDDIAKDFLAELGKRADALNDQYHPLNRWAYHSKTAASSLHAAVLQRHIPDRSS